MQSPTTRWVKVSLKSRQPSCWIVHCTSPYRCDVPRQWRQPRTSHTPRHGVPDGHEVQRAHGLISRIRKVRGLAFRERYAILTSFYCTAHVCPGFQIDAQTALDYLTTDPRFSQTPIVSWLSTHPGPYADFSPDSFRPIHWRCSCNRPS